MVTARIERNTIHDHQWGILVLGKVGQAGLSELPVVIHENTIHSSIWIWQSTTVAVSKNAILRNEASEPIVIAIDDSGDIVISENLIEGSLGVWISQSFVKMMTRNIIRKNFISIYTEGSRVSLSDNQIEQNGWGVAVASRWRGPQDSLVQLTGNRITQQEYYGLVVSAKEGKIATLCYNQREPERRQHVKRRTLIALFMKSFLQGEAQAPGVLVSQIRDG